MQFYVAWGARHGLGLAGTENSAPGVIFPESLVDPSSLRTRETVRPDLFPCDLILMASPAPRVGGADTSQCEHEPEPAYEKKSRSISAYWQSWPLLLERQGQHAQNIHAQCPGTPTIPSQEAPRRA